MKFVVAEINDLGGYTILREADSLSGLSNIDILPGAFPAVFVSRDDIKRALDVDPDDYDDDFEGTESITEMKSIRKTIEKKISDLTDEEMIEICSDLQDVYVEYGSYWDDLNTICEDLHE